MYSIECLSTEVELRSFIVLRGMQGDNGGGKKRRKRDGGEGDREVAINDACLISCFFLFFPIK